MAKIDVILTHNVIGLGAESDQVKVASGYARNYLFPQGLAIPLSAANKRRLESLKQRRAEREAHELNTMSDLAKMLAKITLVITVKTGESEKMFGSITAGSIADELKHQFDVTIDKRKIHLDKPIRNLGEHEIELRLHSDVTANLKVRLEGSAPAGGEGSAIAPTEAPPARGEFRKGDKERSDKPERTDKTEAKKDEVKREKSRAPKAEKAEKA
jgi:large subunit ribosomal protein L9